MRSRAFRVFVAVLIIGAFLQGIVQRLFGFSAGQFWAGLFAVALLLAAANRPTSARGRSGGRFLCDSCRYNDARYCSVPERPNATSCDDYRPRPEVE